MDFDLKVHLFSENIQLTGSADIHSGGYREPLRMKLSFLGKLTHVAGLRMVGLPKVKGISSTVIMLLNGNYDQLIKCKLRSVYWLVTCVK